MKIIRKLFLTVLMLFAFTSCGVLDVLNPPDIDAVNSVSSFSKAEKSVCIIGGTDFMRGEIADKLVRKGWKVTGKRTGKETFAISFEDLNRVTTKSSTTYSEGYSSYTDTDTYEEYYGYVNIYDLRTGKVAYTYDFTDEFEIKISKGIVKAMEKLEGSMR